MTTRTNVGESLLALETNQAELIRRNNATNARIQKLEEIADITQHAYDAIVDIIEEQTADIARLTATLDELLHDLDAITAEE